MNAKGRARTRSRRQGGFTLVELMVVVIVLAILAATIIPQFGGVTHEARVTTARTHIAELEGALERFNLNMDRYPTDAEGLRALVEMPRDGAKSWRGPYIKELRPDPWGHAYRYRTRVDRYGNPAYDLWSRGADGRDGGEGKNQDIFNRPEARKP